MKIQALITAMALASGAAFAQAPNDTAKTPATPAAAAMTTTTTTTTEKTTAKKKVAKKTTNKSTAAKKKATQSMGAGPASPQTDLLAGARRARIDSAYANWKAGAR